MGRSMKIDYLELLRIETEIIERNAAAIGYERGSLKSIVDKFKAVHTNFATLNPEKNFVDYTQWEVPTLMLLDIANPDYAKDADVIAKLYLRVTDAFAYWRILYALFFNGIA